MGESAYKLKLDFTTQRRDDSVQNNQISRAISALEAQESQIIDDLAGMVAVDTSFPPGAGYDEFAGLMEHMLSPLGFTVERVDVPEALWRSTGSTGARTNVIARRNHSSPPHCIYFHVDTVPPGTAWTHPPLALTKLGHKLYGRGTADMKGTIAAALGAIRALDDAAVTYAFEPILLFCTDEEGGLYPGVRYLAEMGRVEAPVLCLNGQAEPRIWAGCFGSVDLRLRFFGRAAHSGAPGNGINAIEEALPVLTALRTLKSEIETRTSSLPTSPKAGPGPLHARLSLTMASGGERGSSLPGMFEINVNRRYLPEENAETVIAEILDVVADATVDTCAG